MEDGDEGLVKQIVKNVRPINIEPKFTDKPLEVKNPFINGKKQK